MKNMTKNFLMTASLAALAAGTCLNAEAGWQDNLTGKETPAEREVKLAGNSAGDVVVRDALADSISGILPAGVDIAHGQDNDQIAAQLQTEIARQCQLAEQQGRTAAAAAATGPGAAALTAGRQDVINALGLGLDPNADDAAVNAAVQNAIDGAENQGFAHGRGAVITATCIAGLDANADDAEVRDAVVNIISRATDDALARAADSVKQVYTEQSMRDELYAQAGKPYHGTNGVDDARIAVGRIEWVDMNHDKLAMALICDALATYK